MKGMIVIYGAFRLDHPFSIGLIEEVTEKSVKFHRILNHRKIDETDELQVIRKTSVLGLSTMDDIDALRVIQAEYSELYWELNLWKQEILKDINSNYKGFSEDKK
jgi:hypothetical protein